MQVNFNAQNYNSSTNFTSLKSVKGGNLLSQFIGEDGFAIVEDLRACLKAQPSFNKLCDKYDVFVEVKPHILDFNGLLIKKGLSLEILAREIRKGGILNLFRKKPPKEKVTGYMAGGVEAKTWQLSDYIIHNFIKTKNGMEADINKFFSKLNKYENK